MPRNHYFFIKCPQCYTEGERPSRCSFINRLEMFGILSNDEESKVYSELVVEQGYHVNAKIMQRLDLPLSFHCRISLAIIKPFPLTTPMGGLPLEIHPMLQDHHVPLVQQRCIHRGRSSRMQAPSIDWPIPMREH